MSERRRPTQRRTAVARPTTEQTKQEHEVRKNIARPTVEAVQQVERRQAVARPASQQARPKETIQENPRSVQIAKRPTSTRPVTQKQSEPIIVHSTTSSQSSLRHHYIKSGESVQEKIAEAMGESLPVTLPKRSPESDSPIPLPRHFKNDSETPKSRVINRETSTELQREAEEEIENIPLDDLIVSPLDENKKNLGGDKETAEDEAENTIVLKKNRDVPETPVKQDEKASDIAENSSNVSSELDASENPEEVSDDKEDEFVQEGEDKKGKKEKKEKKKKEKGSFKKSFLKWLLSLLVLIGIFTGLRVSGVFASEMVIGTSMEPNYHTRDITFSTNLKDVSRYDVIVATSPTGTEVIKRVIGMPGDTITYKNRHVYVNGVLTDETFINSGEEIELNMSGKIELGENEYFLVGDNRENSSDSRIYGAVSGDTIHGVVILRIPLSFQF